MIEVRKDGYAKLFEGNAKTTNEPYKFAKQDVFLVQSDGQIIKRRVIVDDKDFPYAPGKYHVHADCMIGAEDAKRNEYVRVGRALKLVLARPE